MTTILTVVLVAGMPAQNPMGLALPTYWAANEASAGRSYATRSAAGYAARLLAKGSKDDIARAEKILDIVLQCQETRPNHPRHGNFPWRTKDKAVEDLNAVEFVLGRLIPMMIRHGDRLSEEMRQRVLDSIRLGLNEIRNLDVLVAYTNITALDVTNSCLGGELLNDSAIAERGYRKLAEWMAFTDLSGTVYEYNSPTYNGVTLGALKVLIDLVRDEPTRVRARTMAARLGLSVALRIHSGTGRWAGPHSRAYYHTVSCRNDPEINDLREWAEGGPLSSWVLDVLENRPMPMTIVESADAVRDIVITTHQSRSFAMGVTSGSGGEFEGQSNVLMVHYSRKKGDRPGVFYCRYLTNDKWLGDPFYQSGHRTTENIFDEGQFIGVQEGPRAIGMYAAPPRGAWSGLKAALIWSRRDLVDEIRIDGKAVETLPAAVEAGQRVVVADGDVLFAARPLNKRVLGDAPPTRLVEIDGHLVLEICNYRGPEKLFWELLWPGAFYVGRAHCGFVLEVAERSDYTSAEAFAQKFARGKLTDRIQAPVTYRAEGERLWTVEYRRDDSRVGLEVDLMEWKCKRRWTHAGEVGHPMLESPIARQTRTGRVVVGDAVLACGKEPAWLFANPAKKRWVAGYHGHKPAPLALTLPHGKVEIEAMGLGTVVVSDRNVTVEAVGMPIRKFALSPR